MYIQRLLEKHLTARLKKSSGRNKVLILLGARQVGKTTLLEPFVRKQQGILLNCDLEIDRTRLLAAGKLDPLAALRLLGSPALLVVDEAQNLPEIGRIVKGWYDAGMQTKIVLLGSSSLDLLNQTAEPLTGRNEKLYLPPLLFQEWLQTQPWYGPELTTELLEDQFTNQIEGLLLERMVYGSYPEAVTSDDPERYILNLAADYLLRDVLQNGLVKSPEPIRRLLQLLAYQNGQEVSVNELANNLQLARQTVDHYIGLLEQSYVIFRLPAYSTNPRKEISKNSKIFFWDTGIRNALLREFTMTSLRSDIGNLFESWLIAEVAKRNLMLGGKTALYFWRASSGGEVDLIVKNGSSLQAYEIKWSKSRVASSTKGFQAAYDIPVQVINRHNFTKFLLQEHSSL